MAQQTINIGASPNDGTGTPLRTAFQYTNSNFSELYTAVGPSGNNIVVPGSATITGDLTVDTSTLKVDSANNRVGIGTATLFGDLNIQNGTNCRFEVTSQAGGTTIENLNNARNAYLDMTMYADAYIWNRLGSEAMRLNSTGLGVGIAPDATKSTRLSVYQTGDLTDETAPLSVGNTAVGGMRLYAGVNNTNEYVYIGSVKSGTGYRSMILQPNGGNVGIGVTPSAWGSTFKALEIGSGTIQAAFVGQTNSPVARIMTNSYWSGSSFVKVQNNSAGMYVLQNNQHEWHNAATGTGTFSFTQAMTLDTSGRLLVGPTSANASGGVLQLSSGITFPATQVASSDANTLDDYEEGTWTPTVSAETGTLTAYTVISANYTKIGRLVSVTFDIRIDTAGTGTAGLKVSLPFSPSLGGQTCGAGREYINTGKMCQVPRFDATNAVVYFYDNTTVIANTNRVMCGYTYFV